MGLDIERLKEKMGEKGIEVVTCPESNPMERMASLVRLLDQRLTELNAERDEWCDKAMRRGTRIVCLKAELEATDKVANGLRIKLKDMTEDKDRWRNEALNLREKLAARASE